jgi:2-oxoglutarate dehydrogenase E2 component (dihydrolipoamide succinyltransferase)
MPAEVKVPQLGESIVEATVGRWLKNEGDTVTTGEALVELETDKVNMEVMAADSGTLQKIEKPDGEIVGIGDVLALIATSEAPRAVGSGDGAKPETATQPGAVTQTEAAIRPEPAAQAPAAENVMEAASAEPETVGAGDSGRSTPLARRIAAEHGVDISQVTGTGPSGRVTREDVTAHLERTAPLPVPPRTAGETPVAAPPLSERPEERIRMSRRRQTIARRLVEAQHTAAMLTTFNEVDMTAIIDIRKRRRDAFKDRYGIGLGFMSFFTRAAIGALRDFPLLNAEIQGDEIILKRYYDIGIAVSTDEGLVVPVVRDADTLSFAEIERRIADLATRARDRQLTLEELQGGTFTITNGGIFGSLMSTPILNAPQVGILGMHKIQERPVVVDGQIVVRPMMYLALSYDHRIVDGSEAVRFLARVKDLIEDPTLLLIEG